LQETSGGCPSPSRAAVTVSVTNPIVSVPSNGLVCTAGGSVTLDGSTGLGSAYAWSGADLSSYSTASTVASPSTTTVYSLTVTTAGCSGVFTSNVGVISGASATPTATPATSCYDPSGVITLNSNLSSASFGVSSITFAPASLPGSGVTTLATGGAAVVTLSGGGLDDGGWGGIPIGFNYNFFGTNFTSLAVGTNGLLMFGTVPCYGTGAGCLGQYSFTGPPYFPNVLNPANVIGLMLSDMNFSNAGSSLRYWTDGIAPTRRFVLSGTYTQYSGGAATIVQCMLYETTGIVEVHITSSAATAARTIGLQDATRTVGAVAPGWSARTTTATSEAWRFVPPASYTYLWSPGGSAPTSDVTTFTGVPASFTPYYDTVTVTNPTTSCVTRSILSYTVNATPTTPSATSSSECSNPVVPTCSVATTSGTPTPVFNWYDADSAGTLLQTGTSNTYTSSITATTTFYVSEVSGICESPRVAVTATVPTLTVVSAPSNGLICAAGGTVDLSVTATMGGSTVTWSGGSGLSTYSGTSTVASPTVTTAYTVTETLGSCVLSATANVGVITSGAATPTATPASSCYDPAGVITLNSNLSSASFSVSSTTYAPATMPGSGVSTLVTAGVETPALTSGTLDDGGWSSIPLGFSYNYFGNVYSSVNIGTNGVLQFGTYSDVDLGDFSYVGLPDAGEPANVIAPLASDMYFTGATNTGSLQYWNDGIAPTRRFIVQYTTVPQCCSPTGANNTLQLILYETTGVVEVHVTSVNATNAKTIGLQDLTRLIGATAPGRNGFTGTISTPEAWRFTPPASYTYLWSPGGSAPTSGITTFTGVAASLTPYYDTLTVTNPTTGCVTSSIASYNVNDIPVAPSVSPASATALAGDSVSYSAFGVSGATFAWYDSASGGTLLSSSSVLTTSSCTSGTNTYYAEQTSGICASATRTPVTLTINPLTSPTATSTTECSNPVIPTCSVTATNGFATPKFNWYDAASGGTLLQTGTSNTYTSSISATTTFYVCELSGSCESPRVAVTSTLPALLTVGRAPSSGMICASGDSVILSVTPSMVGSTLTWTGGSGLSTYTGATTVAKPSVNTVYTVTETLGACILSGTATVSIIVGSSVPVPTAFPNTALTCEGPINLDAGLSTTSFTVTSIPYAYSNIPPGSGSAIALATDGFVSTALASGTLDDGGWSGIPLGFTYNYFGNDYTTINVGTNGVVQFGAYSAGDLGDYTYVGLPSVGEPANIIAVMASDMDLRTKGKVKYWTEGTAPTRVFIIDWDSMGGYFGTNGYHTMQLKLYETTGVAEVHVQMATKPSAKTIGLQDSTRLIGSTAPGRNSFTSTITAPEAWRFSPPAAFTFSWLPTTGLSSPSIANPVISSFSTAGVRNYTVYAYNTTTGCTTSAPVSINVSPISTIFTDTISLGSSYLFDGVYRTLTGTYVANYTSYLGCDSIVTLNLNVRPALAGDVLCAPISFAASGVFHEASPRNLASTNPDCDTLEGNNRYASTEATEPTGSAAGGGPGASTSTTFSYTGAMQSYIVPGGVTSISIEAFGAQGGSATSGFVGGLGARMKGSFSVSAGDQLLYIIGGVGISEGASAGGGGATYVAKVDPSSSDIITTGPFAGLHVTPLIIAAGGGGIRAGATSNGNPGVTTNTARTGSGVSSSGGGVVSGTTPGNGGDLSAGSYGSAGAGFRGDGNLDAGFGTGAASSFLNGGVGGSGICSAGGINGGFGGGGSGGGCDGGGGGGGYTGGDGGYIAGGGGSYNVGTGQSNSSGVNTGSGSAIFVTTGGIQKSMWYQVTAPTCAASSIRFSTNTVPTNFDTRLTAYHRTTPSICTTGYVELASNNDDGVSPMPAASSIVLTPGSGAASSSTYAPGQPVYVQLTGYGGAYGDYGVIVDVDAPDLTLGTVTSSSIAVNLPPAALAVGPVSNIYLRYRIAGIGGSSYGQIILPSSTTSRVISGLVSGSSYDIWAMYRCAADDRWVTKKITASTVAGCTASTSPVVDTSGSCTSVRVSWTTAPLVSRYVVYWRVIGYAGYGLRRVDSLTTSTVISGLTAGANYEFWVSTVCTGGAIATSTRTPFTTCGASARRSDPALNTEEGVYSYNNLEFHHMPITDIANMIEANDPTATEVKLTTLNGGEETSPSVYMMTIRVFDVQGKEMMNEVIKEPSMIGSYDIQLSNYAGGIYFVKVQANNFSETRKLIVDKD
jgi:hypothetical protein